MRRLAPFIVVFVLLAVVVAALAIGRGPSTTNPGTSTATPTAVPTVAGQETTPAPSAMAVPTASAATPQASPTPVATPTPTPALAFVGVDGASVQQLVVECFSRGEICLPLPYTPNANAPVNWELVTQTDSQGAQLEYIGINVPAGTRFVSPFSGTLFWSGLPGPCWKGNSWEAAFDPKWGCYSFALSYQIGDKVYRVSIIPGQVNVLTSAPFGKTTAITVGDPLFEYVSGESFYAVLGPFPYGVGLQGTSEVKGSNSFIRITPKLLRDSRGSVIYVLP